MINTILTGDSREMLTLLAKESIDCSETGYRSYFPSIGDFIGDPDDIVIERAKEIAELLSEETTNKITKKSKRKGRRVK